MSGEGGLDALLDAIARASGLSPRDDWAQQASRGLEHIAVRRGTTVEALSREPSAWPSLLPELLDHLTVRETFFFRHHGHFDFLVDTLHARLSADSLASPCVLSAGCASGEEPYSIAIAIHARLGANALARVRILASDISPEAIRRARAAVYGAWAFREAPAWLSASYFQRGESGAAVAELVRRAVTFDVGHVVHHAATLPAASVDAVFFRNVAIYLSPSVIADAYREFHRVLRPGGLLIVAPADPRPNTAFFVDAGHESTSIYRARAPGFEPDAPVPSSRRGRAPRSSRAAHLAAHARPSHGAAGRPARAAARAAPPPAATPAPAPPAP
ncbi:CheR family methyltransferase, partial [Polyangium sp. 15x6]|uniref:CheR family methyltransferase n=1 Tax=Polyangium sp. 15x6 TaxID=3042687 RepID=UPI00249A0266